MPDFGFAVQAHTPRRAPPVRSASRRAALTGSSAGGGTYAADAEQHRGQPARVERALFAGGEREDEVGELRERARCARCVTRPAGRAPRPACSPAARGAEPGPSESAARPAARAGRRPRGRRARAPRRCAPPRPAELFAGVRREVCGSRVPARAPAGGDEHDRALRLPGGEHPREFEQRRGPGELRLRAPARGVAVGEEHDRGLPGGAGPLRDHRRERALPVDRLRAEAAGAHREASRGGAPQPAQASRHVGGEPPIARAAGAAVGEAPRRGSPEWRRRARLRRPRGARLELERGGAPGQGEPRDHQREQQREEGCAVDTSVEHLGETITRQPPAAGRALRTPPAQSIQRILSLGHPESLGAQAHRVRAPGAPAGIGIVRACSSPSPSERRRSPTTPTSAGAT